MTSGDSEKRSEVQLRLSEEELHRIVETMTQGLWVTDGLGKTIFVNSALVDMLGYSAEEIMGKPYIDFVSEEERAASLEVSRRRRAGEITRAPRRLRRKDGSELWAFVVGGPLRDEKGQFIGVMATLADITEHRKLDAELRESELRYRTLFEKSPNGVVIADLNSGRIIAFNDKAALQLGYSREEFEQLRVGAFASTNDKGLRERAERLRHGTEESFETQHRTRTGEIRDVQITMKLVELSGKPVAMAIINDITERKRVQEALFESELKYRRIVETANEGILVVDPESVIVFANQRFAQMFGYAVNELIGRSTLDLVYEEDRAAALKRIAKRKTGFHDQYEARLRRKDGTPVWVLVSGSPMFDEEGRHAANMGLYTDITERKKAEERQELFIDEIAELSRDLTAESDVLNTIMEHTSAQLVYLDRSFNFIKVNQAYAHASGYAIEDLIGRNHFDLFPSEQNRALFEQVRDTGEPIIFHDRPFTFPDHPERGVTYWDWTLVPVKDAFGKVQGLVLSLQETTSRVRAEDELRTYERLATIGQLSGNISHELRNPLATIDSSVYYLKNKFKDADEKTLAHLDRIRAAVERSTSTIQSLLDLTRMKEPRRQNVDVRPIISRTLDSFRVTGGIKVVRDLPDREVLINADSELLYMAFRNLVKNALEAMESKGVLTVRAGETAQDIFISVTDTGAGIPPENLDKIFQPLFTTKAKGVGLGLALTKMIVDRHGGKIRVESQPGTGTTITVRLPRNRIPG